MKKNLLKIMLFGMLLILSIPFSVSGVDTVSNKEKINARILPIVWYSDLAIKDGESIKIYAGIQNNSNIDFNGTVSFIINNEELSKKPFSSKDDEVSSVFTEWVAKPGKNEIEVKIIKTDLPESKTLVSYNTDKSTISITRKITLQDIEEVTTNTVSKILQGGNSVAKDLVAKIEDYKKPTEADLENEGRNTSNENTSGSAGVKNRASTNGGTDNKTSSNSEDSNNAGMNNTDTVGENKSIGKVLGETFGIKDKDGKIKPSISNFINSAFNILLEGLIFLVQNWIWTLLGLLLILIFYWFF